MARLQEKPGFVDGMVRLNLMRNMSPELIGGGARKNFGQFVALPFVQMLYNGVTAPNADLSANLAVESKATVVGAYDQLKNFAIDALAGFGETAVPTAPEDTTTTDTPEKVLGDILQGWTNTFRTQPENVEMEVYSKMLDVLSQPGTLGLLEASPDLNKNAIVGFNSFSNSMRASLAHDLAQEQGSTVPLFKSSKEVDESKLGLLEFIEQGFSTRYEKPAHSPRLFEVLNMTPQPNGDIVFTPKDDPRIRGNATVQAKARHMTKMYGQTFGKLVRVYTHTVLGHEDYKVGVASYMEFPEWSRAFAGVDETKFTKEGGEE